VKFELNSYDDSDNPRDSLPPSIDAGSGFCMPRALRRALRGVSDLSHLSPLPPHQQLLGHAPSNDKSIRHPRMSLTPPQQAYLRGIAVGEGD